MWNFVFLSSSFLGSDARMTSSITASASFFEETASECWVETTTVSIRTGLRSRYSTVTCDLPSGRRKSSPSRRALASWRVTAWAYWIGAGISSGVSSHA